MKQMDWKRPKRSCASAKMPIWPDAASNGLAISKRICEKVPNENCRVLSKMRPKRNKINSQRARQRSNRTHPIDETEGRRRGEKSKICSPSLHISYFGRGKTTWNKAFCCRYVFANPDRFILRNCWNLASAGLLPNHIRHQLTRTNNPHSRDGCRFIFHNILRFVDKKEWNRSC